MVVTSRWQGSRSHPVPHGGILDRPRDAADTLRVHRKKRDCVHRTRDQVTPPFNERAVHWNADSKEGHGGELRLPVSAKRAHLRVHHFRPTTWRIQQERKVSKGNDYCVKHFAQRILVSKAGDGVKRLQNARGNERVGRSVVQRTERREARSPDYLKECCVVPGSTAVRRQKGGGICVHAAEVSPHGRRQLGQTLVGARLVLGEVAELRRDDSGGSECRRTGRRPRPL
mmetsp:Transcript_11126/g.35329  ORF Transcript_11126/g.35329 Transcript_11126/m.35329 type:complete len:228 (-) Transcript_11126:2296-2979(-)